MVEYDIIDEALMWIVNQIGWFGVIYLIASIPIGYALWNYKKSKED